MLGEKSAHKGREAQSRSLKTLYWRGRNPAIGTGSKKWEKIRRARHGVLAHVVTIGNIPSLEWFQAISNGKSRIIEENLLATHASRSIWEMSDDELSSIMKSFPTPAMWTLVNKRRLISANVKGVRL